MSVKTLLAESTQRALPLVRRLPTDVEPLTATLDHTIYGEVSYAAYHGKRWGRIAERFIDALFGKGHCFNSIEWDEVNKPQCKLS